MDKRKYWIATADSRFSVKWKNQQITWSELCEKISGCTRTPEKYAEFLSKSKTDQDRIKDIGGFVGGFLREGRRSGTTVRLRSLITLDADSGSAEWWRGFKDLFEISVGCSAYVYTTHKHASEKPRFRVVIPLCRDVTPEEYEAVARKIAEALGIDCFDDTTYQPSRLMYWPSASSDGEYKAYLINGSDLDPDEWLDLYPDWKDVSCWPRSSRAADLVRKAAAKQQDPTTKNGVIGAFCRAYDVPSAIAKFLADVYEDLPNGRYTYRAGSTSAGAVLYEDGAFLYSNHATDPASTKLCNAFDLVRIHKFGSLDDEVKPGTPEGRLPSVKEMLKFASKDEAVAKLMTREAMESASEDFGEAADAEDTDVKLIPLERTERGELRKTINNVIAVLTNDKRFRNVHTNLLSGAVDVAADELPWPNFTGHWSDNDDIQLASMMEKMGFDMPKQKISDGVQKYADDRARHPIRDYIDRLEWDGAQRVDTLLIDYLGAEDTEYTRAVTRKTLCAAVKRVLQPGCKFDTILVLNGPQGCGKSTLVSRLGGDWYSDSLSLSDVGSKAGPEKLQGYWILEIGELAGMRKAEIETLRGFLSRQDDIYREAYARRPASHPRQNVFFGTTNAGSAGYLRDPQGNRRFWDVPVSGVSEFKPWELEQDDIDQIWAEAKVLLEAGEVLALPPELMPVAEKRQREMLESDPREGLVREYLDILIPEDWYKRSVFQRRNYYDADFGEIRKEGCVQRTKVCAAEIWVECFKQDIGRLQRKDSLEISNIMKKIEGWEKAEKPVRIAGYGLVKCYRRA